MTELLMLIGVVVAQVPEAVVTGAEIDAVMTPFKLYGALGALAGALSVVVQIFKKAAPSLWLKLPKWGRLLLVFLFAAGGACMLSYLTGIGWVPAVIAGLVAGAGAIGGNQSGKALVEAVKKDTSVSDPPSG
jgi:hypothetical protein